MGTGPRTVSACDVAVGRNTTDQTDRYSDDFPDGFFDEPINHIFVVDVNGDGVAGMRIVVNGDHHDFTNFVF